MATQFWQRQSGIGLATEHGTHQALELPFADDVQRRWQSGLFFSAVSWLVHLPRHILPLSITLITLIVQPARADMCDLYASVYLDIVCRFDCEVGRSYFGGVCGGINDWPRKLAECCATRSMPVCDMLANRRLGGAHPESADNLSQPAPRLPQNERAGSGELPAGREQVPAPESADNLSQPTPPTGEPWREWRPARRVVEPWRDWRPAPD